MSKLFLGNIPHASTKQEIASWVESFGFPVESVQIIRDRATGGPRGFGFVLLKAEGRSSEAIEKMNGKLLAERSLTVNEAKPLNNSPGPSDPRPGRRR